MGTHVFVYNDVVFADLESAKRAAHRDLVEYCGKDPKTFFLWELLPRISISKDGMYWQGIYSSGSVTYTAEIYEQILQ